MTVENKSASLWMGDLEPYMDEAFIKAAFFTKNYTVYEVKEIKLKGSGDRANYCFVDFGDVDRATDALHKLQGKVIPGTDDQKRFKLNVAGHGKGTIGNIEYSLFVGDLSNDVTDKHLLSYFRDRYKSVRAAKIVMDDKGESKGYGFVRFFDESEINDAYTTMQGASGLGQKPIKVSPAVKSSQKRAGTASTDVASVSSPAASSSSNDMNSNMMAWMQAMSIMAPQMQAYMVQMGQWMQQLQHCMMGQQTTLSPEAWGAAALQWQQQARQQDHVELGASTLAMPSRNSATPSDPSLQSPSYALQSTIQQPTHPHSKKDMTFEDGHVMVDHAHSVDVDKLNKVIVETEESMFYEMDNARFFDDFYGSVVS